MVDVLVVSPHPDDAEMGCGGTIAALTSSGRTVALCYLTRGEMGTRGDEQTRAAETAEAMRILGVKEYVYADIKDAHVFVNHENRVKVIRAIRQFRPRLVLAPHERSLHPDHVQASRLVRDAMYLSGLLRIDTGQERFRPESFLLYPLRPEFEPSVLVDITENFTTKMAAIRAYRSQFHDPTKPQAPQTLLSAPDFLDRLEAVARHFGALAGVRYAEGFHADLPVLLRPSTMLDLPWRMR